MACAFAALTSAFDAVAVADHSQKQGCTTSIIVINANDAGSGSLRAAVQNVCPSGLIRFADLFQIQLASEIVVDKRMRIDGTGASNEQAGVENALVRISGSPGHRVFLVEEGADLTLRRVRLSNGQLNGSNVGGAIRNFGQLSVSECRLDGNQTGPLALGGGAVFNDTGASMLVDASTFDNNTSHRGAAIFNSGDAEIYNSTFSGNVTDSGAEVKEGAIQNRGTLLADHITVANNGNGGTAGGLFAFGADTTLINSIFANNDGNDCVISGGTFSSTALFKQSGNCASQFGGDPLLGLLGDNGGVTPTHALVAGSPAIAAADFAFCLETDQRGVARAQPGTCDLGAVEQISIFANGFE